jgi:hypothetical protein
MVLYEIDGNYINAEPMQDSQESSPIKAYNTLWTLVTKSGKVKPMVHILDNKALELFKEEIKKNCDLQLVPPDTHCQNLAERAIQMFNSLTAIDAREHQLFYKLYSIVVFGKFLSVARA